MSNDSPLPPEQVFRAFWLMCVALAELVYSYNESHPGELRCEWRRHSLVIACKFSTIREIGIQRRKDLAFCVTTPEGHNIWQARIIPTASGIPGFAHRANVVGNAAAADSLFQTITAQLIENRVEMARAAGQA